MRKQCTGIHNSHELLHGIGLKRQEQDQQQIHWPRRQIETTADTNPTADKSIRKGSGGPLSTRKARKTTKTEKLSGIEPSAHRTEGKAITQ